MSIRIGILGYGNIGKGVEKAISLNPDMELVAIFTRRDIEIVESITGVKVVSVEEVEDYVGKIDVMVLCGGSATDLPAQTPKYAKLFNVIDSFDTHAKIPEHFKNVDAIAKESSHLALISCGWDPGAFSLNRVYAECFLPKGNTYTFWGKGVSQGHSDAIRRVKGVKNAIQYTVPIDSAVDKVRSGLNPSLSTREKHLRECYVVLEEGADKDVVEKEIVIMPNYFADYDTTVHFISEEELLEKHSKMPHGGFVIRSGKTGTDNENTEIIEYSLKLDSNPEFTACILLAYARAVYRMSMEGKCGAISVLDVPPAMLSLRSRDELLKELL